MAISLGDLIVGVSLDAANLKQGLQQVSSAFASAFSKLAGDSQKSSTVVNASFDAMSQRWRDVSGKFISEQEAVARGFKQIGASTASSGFKLPTLSTTGITTAQTAVHGLEQALRSALSGDIRGAMTEAASAIMGIGGAAGGAAGGISTLTVALGAVAVVVGVVVAALAAMKMGLDYTMQQGSNVKDLQNTIGSTAEEASTLANMLKSVGLSPEEATPALKAFTNQVNDMDYALKKASTDYATQMQSLSESHAEALSKINSNWQAQSSEAASQIAQVWSDLRDKRIEIETNLADTLAGIQENLQAQLTELAYNYNKQVADLAREREKINADAAKAQLKLAEDTARQLADIDRNLAESLVGVRSGPERRRLKREAADRKADILAQAAERKKEIEDARQERLAELAERRKEMQEQYEHQKMLAEMTAKKQIEAAEKAAQKQIEASDKAAAKQVEAIEKSLAAQAKARNAAISEENKSNAKAAAAAKKLLDAPEETPFARALKAIGVSIYDTEGKLKKPYDLLMDILGAVNKMPDRFKAASVMMDLFGARGGLRLMELAKWMDYLNAHPVGPVYSQEDLEQIEKFNIAVNMLGQQFDVLKSKMGLAVLEGMAAWGPVPDQFRVMMDELNVIWTGNNHLAALSMQQLGDIISDWGKAAEKTWKDLCSASEKTWNDWWTAVKITWGYVTTTWDNLVRGVKDGVDGIKTAIVNKWTEITTWLGTLPATMLQLGIDIITGLINGINSKIEDFKKAFTDLINGAVNNIKNTLGLPTTPTPTLPTAPTLPPIGGGRIRTESMRARAGESFTIVNQWPQGIDQLKRGDFETMAENAAYRAMRRVTAGSYR